MWHELLNEHIMKTSEGNNKFFKKQIYRKKKTHVKSMKGTKLFGRVIKFGLCPFGMKPHNSFSISISKEIIEIVQKQ